MSASASPSTVFQMNTGDLQPALQATLLNADGSVANLTGASAVFTLVQYGKTLFSKAAVIVNAAEGIVQYNWQSGDTNYYGTCQGTFIVTYASGLTQSFPVGSELDIVFPAAPAPTVTTYSQIQDAQRELQGFPFSDMTNPSAADVATYITVSDDFINGFCGHDWWQHNNITEYYDGYSTGPRAGLILLKQLPVVSVTQVQWYDGSQWQLAAQGKPLDVAPAQAYEVYLSQGKIQFYYLAIDGMNEFEVTYNAGYASVPLSVTRLSALLTALKVVAVWTQGTLENYMIGNLRVAYPKDGKYGVLWQKLTVEANRLMLQLSARRIQVGFG